jgi:hypothetical protein
MKSQSDKTFRSFRRQILKVRSAVKSIPDGASLNYHLKVEAGQVTVSAFEQPEEMSKVLVAVLMRPLLDPNSPIECSRVWELVKQRDGIDSARCEQIDEAFQRVEAGGLAFTINGQSMNQRDLYEVFANGEFFHDASESARLLKALRFGPMTEMLWFHFYNYSHDMYLIASAVLAAHYHGSEEADDLVIDPKCIYCLSDEGSFTSEEHVIPEALGNDEAVLQRGWVCDSCNNECSKLDQFLVEFEPLSLQRVLNVPFTKGGKLPRAEFGNVIIEKRMPRVIRLIDKTKTPSIQVYDRQEDGTVKFNFNVQGKKPLDVQKLGRALLKIALGMVAFQSGRERACHPRYDLARSFIAGKSDFDNFVALGALPKDFHVLSFRWLEADTGTLFGANFYGVGFVSNLEPEPKVQLDPSDASLNRFSVFSLRDEIKESGS